MNSDWTVLLVTHTAAATIGVTIGVVQLLRAKGDGRHRVVGWLYVVFMMWTAISSFWIRHLRDGAFSWLHILSLVTIVTTTLAVIAIRRGDVRTHRANMLGGWFGAVGAMIFALAIPTRMLPTFALGSPLGALAAVAALAVTVWLLVLAGDRIARFAGPREGAVTDGDADGDGGAAGRSDGPVTDGRATSQMPGQSRRA